MKKFSMSRTAAALGSGIFFLVAPCVVAGGIPWWITHWEIRPPFLGLEVLRVIGAALIFLGAVGLIDSFVRFASEGLGTPAPVAPPKRLVVHGAYQYVRNPMYVAILAAILGQALLFADLRLMIYGTIVWLAFHILVVAYEEPWLKKTFGAQYQTYQTCVPRWIPQLKPWRGA